MPKILQVKKFPWFDVFFEDGWENWSRFMFKNNKIILIGGTPRPIFEVKQIAKQIKVILKASHG